VALATHPYQAPSLKQSKAILILPIWAFMACFEVKLTFTFNNKLKHSVPLLTSLIVCSLSAQPPYIFPPPHPTPPHPSSSCWWLFNVYRHYCKLITSFYFVFCLSLFFTVIMCLETSQLNFCTYSVKGRLSWSSFYMTFTSCAIKIPTCRKPL